MIRKLFSMFSFKGDATEAALPNIKTETIGSIENILEFVEFVVKSLVDAPEEVKISLVDNQKEQIVNICCKKEDIGKIIGKNGKTIMSIRSLVTGAASRINKQVNVEVLDQVAN